MSMFLQSDGSDQKFVVQINAGGVTFEAYPSLKVKESKTLNLAFDDFASASWDTANAGRKLTPRITQLCRILRTVRERQQRNFTS